MNEVAEGKQQKPGCGCGKGCILAVIVGTVLFSFFLILFGIVVLIFAITEEGSFSISDTVGSMTTFYDGLQESTLEGKMFSSNKIALIEIRGVIIEGDGRHIWEMADSRLIMKQLRRAQHDPKVKAVILFLDTPGGEVTAADNIYKKVKELREAGKIVVAYMNTVAASGGYYVAVASDYIVAHRMCVTGSIGVIMRGYNYKGLLDKIGVFTETYKSGVMKDMLDGSRERTEQEKQLAQKLIDNIYTEFVEIVAEAREKLTVDDIKNSEIGDGRIFLGKEALELDLVDATGYYEDALNAAIELAGIPENDYKIVTYNKILGFADLFSKSELKSPKISIDFGKAHSWDFILEPGKPYFLPSR